MGRERKMSVQIFAHCTLDTPKGPVKVRRMKFGKFWASFSHSWVLNLILSAPVFLYFFTSPQSHGHAPTFSHASNWVQAPRGAVALRTTTDL